MSQYPVVTDQGVQDGVNYLLSGPSGLGQNFQGFSAYTPGYLTGNYRLPYSQSTTVQLYVPPIALSNAERLDGFTWKFTFASTQTAPPFSLGNGVDIEGVITDDDQINEFTFSGVKPALAQETVYSVPIITVTGSGYGATAFVDLKASGVNTYNDTNTTVTVNSGGHAYKTGDSLKILGTALGGTTPTNDMTLVITSIVNNYDGAYNPIGVVKCTNDYVILKTSSPFTAGNYISGGTATYQVMTKIGRSTLFYNSTDCNARVTVQGATDRVFVSAQLDAIISYVATSTSNFTYTVAVNRYIGSINNDPINPDYIFNLDATISKKSYSYTGLSGTGTLDPVETIFTTVIDRPVPGYYWYILEVAFQDSAGGTLFVTEMEMDLRSLSAQVVKP